MGGLDGPSGGLIRQRNRSLWGSKASPPSKTDDEAFDAMAAEVQLSVYCRILEEYLPVDDSDEVSTHVYCPVKGKYLHVDLELDDQAPFDDVKVNKLTKKIALPPYSQCKV